MLKSSEKSNPLSWIAAKPRAFKLLCNLCIVLGVFVCIATWEVRVHGGCEHDTFLFIKNTFLAQYYGVIIAILYFVISELDQLCCCVLCYAVDIKL